MSRVRFFPTHASSALGLGGDKRCWQGSMRMELDPVLPEVVLAGKDKKASLERTGPR